MKGVLSRKLLLLVFLLVILQGSIISAASTISNPVQVTLYMHEGSTSGPVLAGMLITGQDGNGVQFSRTTDSSGSISLSGAPGDWQFSASKDGYDSRSWGNYIAISKNLNGFLTKTRVAVSTTPIQVQVTLYIHDGSTSGPVLTGILITGQDGNGIQFSRTTDSSGSISLSGAPGDWQFSASKDGYDSRSWGNYIAISKNLDGYLTKTRVVVSPVQTQVQLTLCVHETNPSGPVLPGVKITGYDGAGTYFEKVTDSMGTVIISGSPGDWSYSGSKDGYISSSWGNNAYTTRRDDRYLQKTVAATQTTTTGNTVQVTLYMHDGSPSGATLSEVLITGNDGNGSTFSKSTDSSGAITISGAPGIWQFSSAKTGYVSTSWQNAITSSQQFNGYLIISPAFSQPEVPNQVKVKLVMHEGSASGPLMSGILVSGQDGAGTTFSQITDNSGTVTLSGIPGTWHFSAAKIGYNAISWPKEIDSTSNYNGYLIQSSQISNSKQNVIGNYESFLLIVPKFYQNDPNWTGDILGTGSGTLGGYGCAVTSAAMVLKAYETENKNPSELNQWLIKHDGFDWGNGEPPDNEWDHIKWSKIPEASDYPIRLISSGPITLNKINGYIDLGYPVIAQVVYKKECIQGLKGDSTHYVVITGYRKNQDSVTYTINDPFNNNVKNSCSVTGSATTIPDPEGRFRTLANGKSGAEEFIKSIIVYEGPTSKTLSQQNEQTSQIQSSVATEESKSNNWFLNFITSIFPKTQIQQSTVYAATTYDGIEQDFSITTNTISPTTAPQTKISKSTMEYQSSEAQSSSVKYYRPMGKPFLISPGLGYIPGENVYTRTPTLTWKSTDQAEYYSLTISKSPYRSDNIVYSKENILGTSFTIPDNTLEVGEKYCWDMYAYNSAGKSGISSTLYFNVKQ